MSKFPPESALVGGCWDLPSEAFDPRCVWCNEEGERLPHSEKENAHFYRDLGMRLIPNGSGAGFKCQKCNCLFEKEPIHLLPLPTDIRLMEEALDRTYKEKTGYYVRSPFGMGLY